MFFFQRSISTILLVIILATCAIIDTTAQDISAKEPVLITSCGQSPGALKMKVFMKRKKYDFQYELQGTSEILKKKKFNSVIIVTGASLKGMGAAGVSIKDEMERVKSIIAEAKKQNLTIIGAHIEGKARRAQGADSGDNSDEMSIDLVCPEADIIIVRKDGNEDGRFTAIAKDKKIPLKSFDKNLELAKVLAEIYNK